MRCHFRARDAADSTSSGNSDTTRPGARVCAALRSCDVMSMMMHESHVHDDACTCSYTMTMHDLIVHDDAFVIVPNHASKIEG
jgi:hypothetical protein